MQLRGMYELRYKVFIERLEWDVEEFGHLEIDQFDYLNPYYIIAENQDKTLGCWRILPTTGEYMANSVFSYLSGDYTLPNQNNVWELSRFAVDDSSNDRHGGLSSTTIEMLNQVLLFAFENNIDYYITVTSTGVERLMKNSQIPVERIGKMTPTKIGRVSSVLCKFDMDHRIMNTLIKLSREAGIDIPNKFLELA